MRMAVLGDLSRNTMSKGFIIEMCSDGDFEGMVIDISYDMQTVASINYDKGIKNMEIEIVSLGANNKKLLLPFQDFVFAIEKAQKLATKCAQEDLLREKYK